MHSFGIKKAAGSLYFRRMFVILLHKWPEWLIYYKFVDDDELELHNTNSMCTGPMYTRKKAASKIRQRHVFYPVESKN